MNDEAAQLLALEAQAAQADAQLDQDLVAAHLAAAQVAQQLAQLQVTAATLSSDEDLAAVCLQVRQLSPPSFEGGPARAGAFEARRAALQHRRAAGEALRAALDAFRRRTAELELRVVHQAMWLAQAQRRVEARRAAPVAPAVHVAPASRRESPRVALCTEVDLGSDSNFYGGFSTNLSEGGLFIASVCTPPPAPWWSSPSRSPAARRSRRGAWCDGRVR